jgi:tetratricopeptide (TPR) repeat protein
LAALGIVLTWTTGRRPWMLYAVLVALAASVAAFYVFGRYRFSLVPVLVLFAGAGLFEIGKLVRGSGLSGKVWSVAAVVMALAAVGSNWQIVRSEEILANAYFNLGWKLEGEERADGDAAAAQAAYEHALAIRPAYPDALNNLGNLLARAGRIAQARERFAAAVAVDPRHANAQLNLGKALVAEGKPTDAVPHLEQAVRLRPGDPVAREQLAKTLFGLRQPEAAVPHYAELARLNATPANHNNLASALAAAGQLRQAVEHYQAALRLDPGFAEAHDNLAVTYLHLRDPESAAMHYAEVVRLRPDSEQARDNLERVRRMLAGAKAPRRPAPR